MFFSGITILKSNLQSYSCHHIYGTSSSLPTQPFIPRTRAFMRRCPAEIIQSRLTTDDTLPDNKMGACNCLKLVCAV